jgi:ATP-dependent protease ClpP protease subunit
MKFLLCATALALSLIAPASHAANIWIDPKFPEMIDLQGEIVKGDGDKFSSVLNQAFQHGTPIKAVRLNSVGGQVMAGVDIANKIRTLGLNTIVGNGDECASMCVLMFAAGAYRGHFSTGRIGVHSVTMDAGVDGAEGGETKDAMAVSTMLARLYKEYGTPDSIIGKMVTTPSDQVTWLKTDELVQSGFSTLLDEVKPSQPSEPTGQPSQPFQPPAQPATPGKEAKASMTCWNSRGEPYQVTLFSDYTIQVHETVYTFKEWRWEDKSHTGLVVTGYTDKGTIFGAVFGGSHPRFGYKGIKIVNACRHN